MKPEPPEPPKMLALKRWRKVAAKQVDADTLAWLAEVAAGVLAAAELKDANARRQAVLNATGIAGRLDLNAYVAEVAVWAADQAGSGKKGRRVMVGAMGICRDDAEAAEALRKRAERAADRLKTRR